MQTTLMIQRNPVRTWLPNNHPWVSKAPKIEWPKRVPMICCAAKCDQVSLYRIMKAGFCGLHRTEAYKVQELYWRAKIRAKDGRYA